MLKLRVVAFENMRLTVRISKLVVVTKLQKIFNVGTFDGQGKYW